MGGEASGGKFMTMPTEPCIFRVATFDGGYGRKGVIEIERGHCAACAGEVPVLMVDGSEGEYAPGRMCQECIEKAFRRFMEMSGGS